jgi:hypothetical protein
MKIIPSKKHSLKEEEFELFFHRKLLTHPDVNITRDLDTIKNWVIERGGKPVKSTFRSKKNDLIDLIEINFEEKEETIFTIISWEEWYEVFKKHKLNFIYRVKSSNGKESRFYKICQ